MRRDNHIRQRAQKGQVVVLQRLILPIVVVEAGFVLQDIERRAAEFAAFQRFEQRLGIDERPAGRIDQDGVLLHFGKGLRVEQVRIFPRGRHVQRQHIAFGKERIKGHILRKRADVFAFMQIVRQNAAAKPRQTRNDGAPDPAGPRDADGQARQFAPLHAGQRIILHRRMAQNGFTAAHRH